MQTKPIEITPSDITALTALKTSDSGSTVFALVDAGADRLAEVVRFVELVYGFELEDHGIIADPLNMYHYEIDYTPHGTAIRVHTADDAVQNPVTHALDYTQLNQSGVEIEIFDTDI